MFTSKTVGLSLAITFAGFAYAAESPNLGTLVSAAEIAAYDLTVMPDGTGLPVGSGSVAQGMRLYTEQCLACHGAEGEGGLNDRLAGGHGSLATPAPVKTIGSFWPYATTLFDYIRRAMPYTEPGSLSSDEIYSLTAYLLYINGVVDDEAVMDARVLPEVVMPNADNFVWAYEP